MPQCQNCGKSEKLSKCSGCGKSHYCSSECQKTDWTIHREYCIGKNEPRGSQSTVFDFTEPETPFVVPERKGGIPDVRPTPKSTPQQTTERLQNKNFVKVLNKVCKTANKEAVKKNEEVKLMVTALIVNSTRSQSEKEKIIKTLAKGEKKVGDILSDKKMNEQQKEDAIVHVLLNNLRALGYKEEHLTESKEKTRQANEIFQQVMQQDILDTAKLVSGPIIHNVNDYEVVSDDAPREEKTRILIRNAVRYHAEKYHSDAIDDRQRYAIIDGKIEEVSTDTFNQINKKIRENITDNAFIPYQTLKESWKSAGYVGVRPQKEDSLPPGSEVETKQSAPPPVQAAFQRVDKTNELAAKSRQIHEIRNAFSISEAVETKWPLFGVLTKSLFPKSSGFVTGLVWILMGFYVFSLFTGTAAQSIPVDYSSTVNTAFLARKQVAYETEITATQTAMTSPLSNFKEYLQFYDYMDKSRNDLITVYDDAEVIKNAWKTLSGMQLANTEGQIAMHIYSDPVNKNIIESMLATELQSRYDFYVKDLKRTPQYAITKLTTDIVESLSTKSDGTIATQLLSTLNNFDEVASILPSEQISIFQNALSQLMKNNESLINWKKTEAEIERILATTKKEADRIRPILAMDEYAQLCEIDASFQRIERLRETKDRVSKTKEVSETIYRQISPMITYQRFMLEDYIKTQDANFFAYKGSPTVDWVKKLGKHTKNFYNLPKFHYLLRFGNPIHKLGVNSALSWIENLKPEDANFNMVLDNSLNEYVDAINTYNMTHPSNGADTQPNQTDPSSGNVSTETPDPPISNSWGFNPFEIAKNAYWAYHYAAARSWDMGVETLGWGPMMTLSIGAELIDVLSLTPASFLIGGTELENIVQSWSTGRKTFGWSCSMLQMAIQAHNRFIILPMAHATARDLLLSPNKGSELDSIYQFAVSTVTSYPFLIGSGIGVAQSGFEAVMTTGAVTELVGPNYQKIVKIALDLSKYMSFQNGANTALQIADRVNRLSSYGKVLCTFGGLLYHNWEREIRFWPSLERRGLMEDLSRIDAIKNAGEDEILRQLSEANTELFPGVAQMFNDVRRSIALEKQDQSLLKLFESVRNTETRIYDAEKKKHLFAEALSKLEPGKYVSMSDDDLNKKVADLRTELADLQDKYKPSQQLKLSDDGTPTEN